MRWPSLGGNLSRRKYIYYFLSIIIILLAGWLIFKHFHKPQSATEYSASFIDAENNIAQQQIKSNDYKSALDSMVRSGTAAAGAGNWQQAKSIYVSAINSIPNKYIDWTVYDSLYVIANELNDKNLQITSLQKALTKAQQPNSGAPASTIDLYKSRLKELGA